jgi:hypothetical protein
LANLISSPGLAGQQQTLEEYSMYPIVSSDGQVGQVEVVEVSVAVKMDYFGQYR